MGRIRARDVYAQVSYAQSRLRGNVVSELALVVILVRIFTLVRVLGGRFGVWPERGACPWWTFKGVSLVDDESGPRSVFGN